MITIGFSTRKIDQEYIDHIKQKSFYNTNEIVFYENNGDKSLTEVYNIFLNDAKHEIVLLIHDDLILPNNFDKKLVDNFNNSDYGILGLAGTVKMGESGTWWEDRLCLTGKVWHQNNGTEYPSYFSPENEYINDVVVIDGLFIGVHKNRIKSKFNEMIPGFHFYDVSFCIDNFNQGVKIGVFFYGKLIHKSIGNVTEAWKDNRNLFLNLYGKQVISLKPEIKYKKNKYDSKLKNKMVAIIIPSKNNFEILSNCINSIIKNVEHKDYHIFVADTGSDENDLKQFESDFSSFKNLSVIKYDYYHFGKINNDVAFNHTKGYDYLLFCNDDIEFINDCLTEMLKVFIYKNNIGTVGSRLYYPNHLIQHGGVITYQKQKSPVQFNHVGIKTYYGVTYDNTEVIGNTAALMMIKKSIFNRIGGFIEDNKECFEDVLLNLNAIDLGCQNIFAGNSVAYHMESVSRSKSDKKVLNERNDYLNHLMPHYMKHIRNYKDYLKII